jgi:hypothetical protein
MQFEMPGSQRFNMKEYRNWRARRFKAITRHFGKDFFQGKTLLELGAGCGNFGKLFHMLGAKVTCFEGRPENVKELKELHPYLDARVFDMDNELIEEDYDIILHQGVLYHIKDPEANLKNVCARTNLIILETHVDDIEKDELRWEAEPLTVCDSSINGLGCRPTLRYVENRLLENGFNPMRCPDRRGMNSDHHLYEWEPTNSGQTMLRMMWFAQKIDGNTP